MFKTLSVLVFLVIQFQVFSLCTAPEFTAVYDSRKHSVKIKWQTRLTGIKAFVIQRSADNNTWADIALKEISNSTANKAFSFEDDKPASGENYYRLKYISIDNKTAYTRPVMVITGSLGYDWIMYPVPVKDVLTLQYRGSEIIKGVITVLIQSNSGNILTRVRNSSLTRLIRIPVNNLGSGIYDLRIVVEEEIIWNQRFIK